MEAAIASLLWFIFAALALRTLCAYETKSVLKRTNRLLESLLNEKKSTTESTEDGK